LMDASATADGSVVDSSTNSHPITTHGDVSQSSFSPYRSGGYSWQFDGNGDMVSTTVAGGLGAVEFTVEFWMYRESDAGYIFNSRTGGENADGFDIKSDLEITTANNRFFNGTSLENNRWYHVALTRDSSYLTRLFIDGVNVGSATVSNAFTGSSVYVGGSPHGNVGHFNGKIADFRIVNGDAVYTENFSVPTERLTEVAGTSLLTCNLPYLQSGLTITGDVYTKPFSPYDYAGYSESLHGGSYVFDGSSRLTLSSQFHVTGEFALETWVHLDDNYSDPFVCGTLDGNNIQILRILGGYPFFTHRDYQSFSDVTAGTIDDGGLKGNTLLQSGQWYHLALTRDSNDTLRIFVNGQLDAAATWSHGFNFNTIGALTSGIGHMQGSMSDFRVVLNSPVYTESFTPPTAPLTAVTGTSLLLSGNNAAIRDESQSVESISVFGNTTVADSSPYGAGKSMSFDGNGDYLSFPALTSLSGDFAIETWVYPTDLSSNRMVFEGRPNNIGGGNYITLQWHKSRGLGLYHDGWKIESGTNELVTNQWQHVALTRSGTSIKLFINGTQVGNTYTSSTEFLMNGSNRIGALYSLSSTWWQGKIADFRIVNRDAIYTANFDVPTAPLGDYSESTSAPAPEPAPAAPTELVGEPSVSSFSHIPSTRYATPGSPAVTDAATGVDVGRPDTGSSASAMIDVTVEVGVEYEFSFTATTQSGDTMFMGVIPSQGATTPEFGYVGDNALGQYPNTVHNRASVSGSGDSQTIVFTATQTDLQIVMWNSYSENLVNVQFISLKATS